MQVQESYGAEVATATEVHPGRVAADIGHIISLWDERQSTPKP